MQKGFSEAQDLLRQAQERAASIIAALQARPRHDAEAERLRRELAEERERLREQERALQEEMRRAEAAITAPEALQPLTAVKPGQPVRVADWDREGVVLETLGEDRALVQVGAFQVEVLLSDLYPAKSHALPSRLAGEAHRSEAGILSLRKQLTVPDEIILIGKTVDEAVAALDKYLDDAALAGLLEVRIVHGKGTGALRRGIHAYLKTHPAVQDFHLAPDEEGGAGATVARLRM